MAEWIKAAKMSDLPADTGHLAVVEGREIALFKAGDRIYAMDSLCPHQGGPLHEGGLNGCTVMCPWHGWEFDVSSGENIADREIKQATYNVKVEGEDIFIEI